MQPRKPNSNAVMYSLTGYGRPEEIIGDPSMPDLSANWLNNVLKLNFAQTFQNIMTHLTYFLVNAHDSCKLNTFGHGMFTRENISGGCVATRSSCVIGWTLAECSGLSAVTCVRPTVTQPQ